MRNRQTHNRRAITLVELLIAIAMLAIVAGLLLSAVQKLRQSAAKADCQNKMRQLALALQQRHDCEGTFPSGHRSYFNRDLLPLSGWTLSLLPYIEQIALYETALSDYRTRWYPLGKNPHIGLSTAVPAFLCPSDYRISTAQVTQRTHTLAAFTSYLGIAGQNPRENDGTLYLDSHIRMAEVTDGASNTLLIGERPPSANFQFGWWYAGAGQPRLGTGDMTLGVREPNLQPITSGSPCGPGNYPFMPATGFDDPCGMFHFWSPHSGGANFAFADGSVRFLLYSANPIMPALATRAGGESLEMP